MLAVPSVDLKPDTEVDDDVIRNAQLESQQQHFKALRRHHHYLQENDPFPNMEGLWAITVNFLANNTQEWRPRGTSDIELPDFPPLHVLVANSRATESLGKDLKQALNGFSVPCGAISTYAPDSVMSRSGGC